MKSNFNAVDGMEKREKILGNRRVHWVSVHDVDWLSMENTGTKSPWHYSKLTFLVMIGCGADKSIAIGDESMTVSPWVYTNRASFYAAWWYFDDSLKFADFLLSDRHDDGEAY